MGRLRAANSISKIAICFLFISILTLFFISGCVVQATPGQISAAKQQNVLLGQGFSSAVYPVGLQQAMDAVPLVGEAQKAVCDREYILVSTSGKQPQWMDKRSGMPALESCQTVTGYTGRWRFGECCKYKYYDVTITPFSLKGQPQSPAVKVVIDPVLTIWCTSADYDKYISLHRTFEDVLKVKCLPVQ